MIPATDEAWRAAPPEYRIWAIEMALKTGVGVGVSDATVTDARMLIAILNGPDAPTEPDEPEKTVTARDKFRHDHGLP